MRLTLTGFDYYKGVPAPNHYIDPHEVTNGGVQGVCRRGRLRETGEDWTESFVREGQTLDWTAAIILFRDGAGRPGPSTWQGGTYPAGRKDWPGSGVSCTKPRCTRHPAGSICRRFITGRTRQGRSLAMPSPARVTSAVGVRWRWARRPVLGPTGPSIWPATSRSGPGTSRPAPATATSSAAGGTIRTTSFSTRIPGRPSTGPTRTGFAASCTCRWPGATGLPRRARRGAGPGPGQRAAGGRRRVSDLRGPYQRPLHAIRRTGRVDRRCLTAVAA